MYQNDDNDDNDDANEINSFNSQVGTTLVLKSVEATHSGLYTCSSTNFVHPSGKERQARTANASVTVSVRHRPGNAAFVTANGSGSGVVTAVEGKGVTVVCRAEPPGYPEPR